MTPKAKPQPEQKKEAVSKTTTTAPAPALVTANKQTATFDRLKEAWVGRGADLSKMTTTMDGKFMLVTVGEQWPVIRIGASGGIELPAIKSYPKAFDAAIIGDQLLAKQVARSRRKPPLRLHLLSSRRQMHRKPRRQLRRRSSTPN